MDPAPFHNPQEECDLPVPVPGFPVATVEPLYGVLDVADHPARHLFSDGARFIWPPLYVRDLPAYLKASVF